jgi:hypothetical protein
MGFPKQRAYRRRRERRRKKRRRAERSRGKGRGRGRGGGGEERVRSRRDTQKGGKIEGKTAKKTNTSIRNNNTIRVDMRERILLFPTEKTRRHILSRNVILMT